MPRVNTVEKARKADPRNGIAVGDKYYWWTFKNQRGPGTKVKSKTYPKPSQLTRSAFKSQWRGFAETMAELALDDGLYDALQEIAGSIRELGDECQSSLDNMPEGLQQGSTGEMLQERIDNCESWASEIEGLDDPGQFDEGEVEDLQTFDEFLEDGTREPVPAVLLSSDEYKPEDMDAFQAWAEQAWEDWGTEQRDKIEEARTEHDAKFESLRDDAVNADPGEV